MKPILRNFKIRFSPFGNPKLKCSIIIYNVETQKHAINVLNRKRRDNGLVRAWILKVKEVKDAANRC